MEQIRIRMENYSRLKQYLAFTVSVFVGMIIFSGFGCSKSNDSTEKTENIIIARAGDRSIDWKLLRRSFYLNPKWGKGITQKQAYLNQLNYLIDQKLFAQAALTEGLNNDPSIKGYLDFIREKEILKALYRQKVASRVTIFDEELQRAYQYSKIHVKFVYFSTPDLNRALYYQKQFQEKSWKQIALLKAEVDEKGESPFYTFGEMAPEMESVIFRMELGEVSSPIKIGRKWWVVKIIDGYREKFQSEMDYAQNKSKIQKVLFERKAQKISNRYLYEQLKDIHARIRKKTFWSLVSVFENVVKNKQTDKPFPIYLSNEEIHQSQIKLKDLENEVLATYEGGELKVKEFIEHLLNMPAGLRPQVNMARPLKKAIATMIRDRIFLHEAIKMGLDHDATVLYETHHQQDEILAKYWLKRKRAKVEVSPKEIREFANSESIRRLEAKMGKELTIEEIEGLLKDYKFTQYIIQLADSLRHVYPVMVNTTVLMDKIDNPDEIIQYQPIRFTYRELYQ